MKVATVLLALIAAGAASAAPVAGNGFAAAPANFKRGDIPVNPIRKRGGKCRSRPMGSEAPASGGSANTGNSTQTGNANPALQSLNASPPSDKPSARPTDSVNNGDPNDTPPSPAANPSAVAPATGNNTGNSAGSTSGAPNGNKAGISSGDAYDDFKDCIGWWYDWGPTPTQAPGGPIAVPMLWGSGNLGEDQQDFQRFNTFKGLTPGSTPYVMGFNEPDCMTPGSAQMPNHQLAADLWEQLIAPWAHAGSKLLSPSMCHQADETYLTPFKEAIKTPWDYTTVHINKNSMEGVRKDLDHYAKYGKPLWVTEFACVDDASGFNPCTDQGQINQFIDDIVDLLESDDRVVAYAFSNGIGLGNVWRTGPSGALTETGQRYLAAVKRHHP